MEFLILDYLNTAWYATHQRKQDVLLTPKLLTEFLRSWGIEPSDPPTPEEIRALAAYRGFLTGALKELMEGRRISNETAAELNRVLSLAPGVRSVGVDEGKYRTHFEPLRKDWNWVMAEVAESFFALMGMDIGRIRACENPAAAGISTMKRAAARSAAATRPARAWSRSAATAPGKRRKGTEPERKAAGRRQPQAL